MSGITDTNSMKEELSREYNIAFGKVIQRKRKKAGITQAQLGENLGVTKSTVSRYEAGSIDIPASMLPMSCEVCDFKMEEYINAANDILTEQRLKQICMCKIAAKENLKKENPKEQTLNEKDEHYTNNEHMLAKIYLDYICWLKYNHIEEGVLKEFINFTIEFFCSTTTKTEEYRRLKSYIEKLMALQEQNGSASCQSDVDITKE